MHRSYQPVKPVSSLYLQQRWDQSYYKDHRQKVSSALPVVDTKGMQTPAHLQLKLKKVQIQAERLTVTERENHLLASKLARIAGSTGLVDHRNQYHLKSLNGGKRKQELLLVSRENQNIYQRIISRQSEYSRQRLMSDWERTERVLENISRYPKELPAKQRLQRKVKFAAEGVWSTSCSESSSERKPSNRRTADVQRRPHLTDDC